MALTQEELVVFEQALAHADPPTWDPEFRVIKTLMKAFAVEAARIKTLQVQVNDLLNDAAADDAALSRTVMEGLDLSVASGSITDEEANQVVADLNKTVEAATTGSEIAAFAGHILRLAVKIVV